MAILPIGAFRRRLLPSKMCIRDSIGADVPALFDLVLGLHFLEANPDIGLDVLDEVT